MKLQEALRVIGMPPEFRMNDRGEYETVMARWTQEIRLARDAVGDGVNDDGTRARELSQAKEVVKARAKKFCGCGRRKSVTAECCPECRLQKYGASLGPAEVRFRPEVSGPAEDTILIPVKTGAVQTLLQKLEKTGDSVEVKAARPTIQQIAHRLGMACVTREVSRGVFRVWRTDGKSIVEVNALIRERQSAKVEGNGDSFVTQNKD
jgi:hypothetical protein